MPFVRQLYLLFQFQSQINFQPPLIPLNLWFVACIPHILTRHNEYLIQKEWQGIQFHLLNKCKGKVKVS